MKGKYSGSHMTIYGSILPGAASIARSAFLTDKLTERAKYKIKILDWHKSHGANLSLTAKHFGIGRMTLFRWLKRFKARGVIGLNEYSRKPKHLRRPTVSWNITARVVELRQQYPAWSKHKIGAILKREGFNVSVSTTGRILKRKNLIDRKISAKRRKSALRPKMRFPKGFKIHSEGNMIQMDVKHIMLPGGRRYYQFTAIDVLSKRRVLRVYSSESSRNGSLFLWECIKNFPFQIRNIQTDNGSTFLKEFDRLCRQLSIPHYFIYPRHPKQNTYVEISHQADKREFYQQGNAWCILETMQKKIREREDIWNNFRPHEALGQLTPAEYSLKIKGQNLPTKDVIVLQV